MESIDGRANSANSCWHGEKHTVAFSPDGKRVVTAGFTAKIRLWDATTGMKLAELNAAGDPVISAIFSPNGQQVLTTGFNGTVGVWDASSGKHLIYIDPKYSLGHAVFSPDGQRVVIVSSGIGDGPRAGVWETSTGRRFTEIHAGGGFRYAAFSPDGRWLVINTIQEFDAEVFRVLTSTDVERFFVSRK